MKSSQDYLHWKHCQCVDRVRRLMNLATVDGAHSVRLDLLDAALTGKTIVRNSQPLDTPPDLDERRCKCGHPAWRHSLETGCVAGCPCLRPDTLVEGVDYSRGVDYP